MKELDQNKEIHSFTPSIFKTLWLIYKPYSKVLFALLILGFLGRIAVLSNSNVIGYWVDSLCSNSPLCHTPPSFFANFSSSDYISMLAILTTVGFFFAAFYRVTLSRVSALAVSQLYDEVTFRTSRYPIQFFDKTPAGRIITRFSSDYGNVFRMFGGPLAEFIAIIFDLIAMVILMLVASPYYGIILVFIFSFNYLVYSLNKNRLRKVRRELSSARSPSIAHFAETVQGSTTIRLFNKMETFKKRFKELDEIFLSKRIETTKKVISFSMQMNLLTAFIMLLTGLLGYYLVQNNLASLGSVGVAFGFILLSGGTIQMFFEWLAQFEEAMVGVERLDRYLRSETEAGANLPHFSKINTGHSKFSFDDYQNFTSQQQNSTQVAASIEFKNVSLRYNPESPLVLKNVSFLINAGEKIGIVGRTGSGKSSLVQILYRLYPIESGKILINNKSAIDDLDLELYRSQMTFISQDPILFKGTLRENLSLSASITDDHILSVLNRVGLNTWLASHNKGLSFFIEERGKNLSQGEKQLICMARCLLQNSPIVIMDEATSNVDPQSEEVMIKATTDFFKGKTQIIIAHRLTTLLNCDRIIWLDKGELKAIGKVHEVLPLFEKSELSF